MSSVSSDEEVFNGDGVDYSYLFDFDQEFESRDAMFKWASDIALVNGFNLNKASNKKVSRNSMLKYQSWKCDRSGVYNPVKENGGIRQNTSTRKCGCKFGLNVRQIVSTKPSSTEQFPIVWKIGSCTGYHNHSLTHYHDGQRRASAFTEEEKELIRNHLEAQVTPKKIALALHQKSPHKPPAPMAALYNMGAQVRAEERGDRNVAQQTLYLANQDNYTVFFEKDDENVITHIFLAHPDGRRLFRTYYYVILIDSTYKTNRYLLPFVDIIGVTPVGKNFLIGYAMLVNETTEGYQWLLQRLQMMLPHGVVPNAIVTDHERGLIAAVPLVFPGTHHLLCLWHVDRAVETNATLIHEGNASLGKKCFEQWHNRVICARTPEAFGRAITNFMRKWPKMENYMINTWLKDIAPMWARCVTNGVKHYGNTATGRVESSHAVLKKWLETSNKGLNSMFKSIHGMLGGQYAQVRIALENARSRQLVDTSGRLFSLLSGKVAKKAILLMKDELERGLKLGIGINRCGCTIITTHGLLCACQLVALAQANRRVHVDQIDVFWRTLIYEDRDVVIPTDNDLIVELFDQVRNCDEPTRRRVIDAMYSEFHPEEEDVEEPRVKENPRGRPRKSTTRNKSWFEHIRKKFDKKPAKDGPTSSGSGLISFNSQPLAPLERNYNGCPPLSGFQYAYCVPGLVEDSVEAWFDPLNDGHCGFHCFAHAIRGEPGDHMLMRNWLSDEITDPRYINIYDNDVNGSARYYQAVDRIRCNNTRATGPAHWMDTRDCFGYANMFNWVICVISSAAYQNRRGRNYMGSQTYLPLWNRHGATAPSGMMWILHTGNHFIRLRITGNCPMPPLAWEYVDNVQESTRGYPAQYMDRFNMWNAYFA